MVKGLNSMNNKAGFLSGQAESSYGRWIPANTEYGEVAGLVSDLQGAFSFKQQKIYPSGADNA